jgi:hypothetical protein
MKHPHLVIWLPLQRDETNARLASGEFQRRVDPANIKTV